MTIENLITPVGRILWGNPAKSQIKKDQQTKQPVIKDGKTVEQWAFGVAFPKAEFNQKMMPAFMQEAASGYPNGVPNNFSWKIKDGDGVDGSGKPYSLREGYAGCYVLTISTEAFAPPIFKFENGAYRQIDSNEIKCGDYVSLSLNVKVNVPSNRTHTPGLYVNPNGIQFVAYGAEIHNSANAEDMFGAQPQQYQLPAGASLTPIQGGNMAAMPGMNQGGSPAMGQQPQMMGQPAQGGYVAPQPMQPQANQHPNHGYVAPQPIQPAHDFVNNAGMQPHNPAQGGYVAPQPMQPGQGGFPPFNMPQR